MSILSFRSHLGATVAAGALAVLVSSAVLGGVIALFLRDGLPFEQALIAERACSEPRFVSERETCVRAFVAAAQRPAVASR
jgi:hypothetical protein